MTPRWSRDGLYGDWLGDPETEAAFDADADIAAMLRFEAALAAAQAEHGVVPGASARRIHDVVAGFRPDREALRARVARDGVGAPGLIAQLRQAVGSPHDRWLHFGATSQDAMDTSLMLRLQALLAIHDRRLESVAGAIEALDARYGAAPLMAVTRWRRALPLSIGDRLEAWRAPLVAQRRALRDFAEHAAAVQLAGPVGRLDAMGEAAPAVRARLAQRLGLADPGRGWHTDRRRIADCAALAAGTANALGKIGADIAIMAQDATGIVELDGGASSSMPHKVNPVDAELLMALARLAATLQGGVALSGLHETERSGASWTLEWLTLPTLLSASGAAMLAARRLLASITRIN